LDTLLTLRAYVTLFAGESIFSVRTGGTSRTGFALNTLLALGADITLFAGQPVFAVSTISTGRASLTLRACGAL
jgi:hypothetical protein